MSTQPANQPPAKPPAAKAPAAARPAAPAHGADEILQHVQQIEGSIGVFGGARQFLKDSPFWIVSIALHVVVFIILAAFIMAPPVKQKPRVLLNVEEVEVTKEIQPMVREDNLAENTTAAAASGFQTAETLQSAMSETKDVQVEALDVMGIRSVMKSGSRGEFDGTGNDQGLNLIGQTGVASLQGAVDQFAIETLNSISKGQTLVILLIDESRSIVNKDLPIIVQRMDHYFKQISLNLRPDQMTRGHWAVISYGAKPTLRGPPSSDLEQTKAALRRVEVDASGDENVLAAVNYALDQYGGKAKYTLIAALTDEIGSDTGNSNLLEATIARLRKYGARFYVFGREANFGNPYQEVEVEFGGKKYRSPADMGPESPRDELWRDPIHGAWWQADSRNLPSGFPMYALNRMCLATDGIYFLLEAQSKYDERKLYALYYPDSVSRARYDAMMKENPLRRELAETWTKMGQLSFQWDFRKVDQVDKAMDSAEKNAAWCYKQAVELRRLKLSTPPEGRNWTRWMAHADVTVAQLLRLRHMYSQYRWALMDFKATQKTIPENKRLICIGVNTGGQVRGGRQGVQDVEDTKAAIQYAFDQHKGTPWETLCRRLSGAVFGSFIWKIDELPKPGGPYVPPPPV